MSIRIHKSNTDGNYLIYLDLALLRKKTHAMLILAQTHHLSLWRLGKCSLAWSVSAFANLPRPGNAAACSCPLWCCCTLSTGAISISINFNEVVKEKTWAWPNLCTKFSIGHFLLKTAWSTEGGTGFLHIMVEPGTRAGSWLGARGVAGAMGKWSPKN